MMASSPGGSRQQGPRAPRNDRRRDGPQDRPQRRGGDGGRPRGDGGNGNGSGGYTPTFLLYRHPDLDNDRQQRLVPKRADGTWDGGRVDHGLRFTKFFGRWRKENPIELLKELAGGKRTEPVLDWLNPHEPLGKRPKGKNEALLVGDPARLGEAAARMQELADALGGKTFDDMVLASRLLTGTGLPHPTENGFLFHPTLGVPYLRGTALKQVARDWAEENGEQQARIDSLFGAADEKSKEPKNAGGVAFLDALPIAPVTLTAEQITAHYGPYYGDTDPASGSRQHEPADWHEPNPVTLLAVEAPLCFRFGIIRLRQTVTSDDLDKVESWLREGLIHCGVGARTTLGYGRFEVPSANAAPARMERSRPAGELPAGRFAPGDRLAAGTVLTCTGAGERDRVRVVTPVVLQPGIKISIAFQDGTTDSFPLRDFVELKHIK